MALTRAGMRRYLADTAPLANPHFRRLWTANIATVIGAQVSIVAVPAQIYATTGSSAYVGLTGAFGLVPLVVFGLWGGALADVADRRTVLLITTWGLILTSVAFWAQAAMGSHNVWLLLGIFAVQQAFFAVNQPTRTAVLPKLLPAAQLPAANSLSMTLFGAGAVAGPLVGGALIPVLGFSWLYLLHTITLFPTLWAVWKLPPLTVQGAVGRPGLRSVIAGFSYLRGHPVLLMSFGVDLIAMFFGMPRALYPEIAHDSFGGPISGGLAFAILFAAMPAGVLLGGVFSGWVSRVRRHGLAVIVAILVWGLSVSAFGLAVVGATGPNGRLLALAAAALAVGGAADMASSAFRQSMLQSAAEDDVRGRLQGVFVVVVAGGPRLADVAHGAAAQVWGASATVIGGGVLVVVGVLAAAALVPAFVRYRV
ncbi:MFS transporter [Gephyromycinifex aptenodytis]|uniref:MFS transporter n=1 Tax=Gephyromycinifex aptenodytis TaxID=2716227 RepID=UPI001D00B653|nr:MFS transporter [Gephyromycinifex aptenodytis]